MFVGLRVASRIRQAANKGNHFNLHPLVTVGEAGQGAHDEDRAAEFLPDFPDDRLAGRLAGFDLAAGELPFEREVFVEWPLRQQHLRLELDHGANHRNGTGNGHAALLNREFGCRATFPGVPCFQNMKTFLKISLIVLLSLIAIKFIPIVSLGALVGLLVAAVLGAIGLSLLAALVAVAIALGLALSPIWIPVLVVMGAISLFRKLGDRPAPPVVAA